MSSRRIIFIVEGKSRVLSKPIHFLKKQLEAILDNTEARFN
jgi:hypothetical protein